MTLSELRHEICRDKDTFCRACFTGKPTASSQCPPNVFRAGTEEETRIITFVFEKPHDNTNYRTSPIVPIEAYDDRAGIDSRLGRAPSHQTLISLYRLLGFIQPDSEDLHSGLVHLTNAVKCDVSCETGMTGGIEIPKGQAITCVNLFLLRELDVVQSKGIVFFSKNAQRYVMNRVTPMWAIQSAVIGTRFYKIMRVPHTAPTPFNTFGKRGQAYIEPIKTLLSEIQNDG